MSFRIYNDSKVDTIVTYKSQVLPFISSTNPPLPLISGKGGGFAFDEITKVPFYNNGTTWLPVSSGSGSGTVEPFNHVKSGDQTIVTNV